MLVLTRNIGKSVIIGDDIKIAILSVDHDQVHIGITAPEDVKIPRKELQQRTLPQLERGAPRAN